MSDYWLGFLSPFAIALAAFLLLAFVGAVSVFLHRRGWRLELKVRNLGNVSDFMLRRDIWWERSFGPVFVGGWYFEDAHNTGRHINRWLGLGRPNGPVAMVIRVRNLPRKPPGER